MRVRIFHNTNPLALAQGYRPSSSVREVYAYETTLTDHAQALKEGFFLFNLGYQPDFASDFRAVDYRQRGHRSLSVGDVVEVDGRFYAYAHRGWTDIRPPRVVGSGPDI